ncbi:60S ribosomal protein L3 [Tanacetum coccineum]
MQNIQEEDVLNIPRMIGQHDEEEDVESNHSLSKIHKHKEGIEYNLGTLWPVVSRVVIAAVVVKVEDGSPYLSANIESVYLCLGANQSDCLQMDATNICYETVAMWACNPYLHPGYQELHNKETCDAIAIIETPPVMVVGVVAYVNTPHGLRYMNTAWAQHLS